MSPAVSSELSGFLPEKCGEVNWRIQIASFLDVGGKLENQEATCTNPRDRDGGIFNPARALVYGEIEN